MRTATASSTLALATLVGLAGVARADVQHTGDALDDLFDPRTIAVGEAGRAQANGAAAIGLNPSGMVFDHELAFEGDYGYRVSDGASIVTASACDSTSALLGCFYYHYTGADPDTGNIGTHSSLQMGGATFALPLGQNFAIGTGLKYYHFSTDDPAETSAASFALDAGATFHLTNTFAVGGAGYNLVGPSTELPRAFGGGVMFRPVQMLALSFDSRWLAYQGDHSARFGGGAQLFLSAQGGQLGIPIAGGVLHDDDLHVTYLSGGLGIKMAGYGVDVTARFSVDGPSDTEIIASLRLFPAKMSQ